ncbi:MAG: 3-oxoacyl-[acyl-carrier-protein] reductase [Candidatus Omnitrophica bacterium]|nr:3-oxoacyl-[acyl-carrier-protein] reductase [Candidatus Omnitrophota bacterium]MDD5352241.1 3-oxoacyl-[acyl-carrier-protein] reductase [Candidatus Omnitrophota bacterium]MDD5549839.1 3-oxoacyl-[acyl-carrier-protein] reductase [Candidatus Omnitrophota bacterium]
MLKNKIAIVTGGTRGIGRAIVLALAKQGVKVAFNYLKSDKEAKEVLKEVSDLGSEALSFKFDVRDFNLAKEFVEKVKEYFGGLDILVNNAGIIKDKALMLMEENDWREVIDTDLTGYFNLTRACIVGLLKQKSGNIVNITSDSGVSGTSRQTNYSAAKAGIIGFTKSLAKEVAGYNIRVNAVAAGFIDTQMTQNLKPDYKEKLKSLIPKGEFGKPQDVAGAVLFLLSDAADYITGQVLRVDGGMVM